MVETPEKSITDKLSELLGNDSSTVAPYVLVQEPPTPPIVQTTPTSPVNNIEPRNTEDSTPITVNTEKESNTKEEGKHVLSTSIAPVKTPTIEPVNTLAPREEPKLISQDNTLPVDTIVNEITANLQDTLNKQQTPVVKPTNVDTTTIQPTENIKVNTESQTPNLVQQAASNIEQAYTQSAQGISKGTNNVTSYDATKKDINQQISQKLGIPVDQVESRLHNIYNLNPEKYKGLEFYFGNAPELRDNAAAPTVDKISNELQAPITPTTVDNITDKISNEYQLPKKEELPASKIEPTVPNTENVSPTSLQPSQLNTNVETNNESPLSSVPLDNPKLDDIADNTNQTNMLLENLTKAIYMFARSVGNNSNNNQPPQTFIPSAPSIVPKNATSETMQVLNTSSMIPNIRDKFA